MKRYTLRAAPAALRAPFRGLVVLSHPPSEMPSIDQVQGAFMRGLLKMVLVGGTIGLATFFWTDIRERLGLSFLGEEPILHTFTGHQLDLRRVSLWAPHNGYRLVLVRSPWWDRGGEECRRVLESLALTLMNAGEASPDVVLGWATRRALRHAGVVRDKTGHVLLVDSSLHVVASVPVSGGIKRWETAKDVAQMLARSRVQENTP